MKYRMLWCVLVLGLAMALPQTATAGVSDLFGLNMRALSMANAYTAYAEGPAAAFYNPAMLAARSGIEMEAGFIYSLPSYSLKRKDLDGVKFEDDTDELDDAERRKGFRYMGAGVSGRISDWVGLGLYMNLPVSGDYENSYFHPQTPYWLKYESSTRGLQFYPAVAVRIVPNVMVGFGATINLDSGGDVDLALPVEIETGDDDDDDAELVYSRASGKNKWSAGAAFNAGAYYRPFEFLRFGLVYRGASVIRQDQTLKLDVASVQLPVDIEVGTNFTPAQIALGAVGTPFEWWSISLDLAYTMWSQYEEPFPKIKPDYQKLTDKGIDFKETDIIEVDEDDINFADTLVVKLGMEFRPVKHFNVMTGYSYEPTPVPDQNGTTNILDSDMHIIALGFGVNFLGPENDLIRVDVGGQYHLIADRRIEKNIEDMDPFYRKRSVDPELNPGYPRVDVSANNFVGGLTVKFRF